MCQRKVFIAIVCFIVINYKNYVMSCFFMDGVRSLVVKYIKCYFIHDIYILLNY